MHTQGREASIRAHPTLPGLRRRIFAVLVVLALSASACSDDALGQLGGRTSDWIGEVATTATTTTTIAPVLTQPATAAEWVNDDFGSPDPDADPDEVLASVFARAGDSSQFLQASRAEIVAVVPDVLFPAVIPTQVRYITSQLVIESRILRLAQEPTVAFGLWSVEPYTRSRSVGQVAVINVATDPAGAEVANDPNSEATCAAYADVDRTCGVEYFLDDPVWRLEGQGGVTHIWFRGDYRYEIEGRVPEDIMHDVIASAVPLGELLSTG